MLGCPFRLGQISASNIQKKFDKQISAMINYVYDEPERAAQNLACGGRIGVRPDRDRDFDFAPKPHGVDHFGGWSGGRDRCDCQISFAQTTTPEIAIGVQSRSIVRKKPGEVDFLSNAKPMLPSGSFFGGSAKLRGRSQIASTINPAVTPTNRPASTSLRKCQFPATSAAETRVVILA